MHVPDGNLSTSVTIVTGVAALAGIALAFWRTRRQGESDEALPLQQNAVLLPVTAAFVFAAQMLNFPVAAGVSAHFFGAALAAALLGPLGATMVLTLVLVVQALLHADGGVSALGANIFNMGVVGGLVAGGVIQGMARVLERNRRNALIAVALAAWLSVVASTLVLCVELAISGTLGMRELLLSLLAFNSVAGVGEVIITVAALSLIIRERPELIVGWELGGSELALPASQASAQAHATALDQAKTQEEGA